MTVTLAGMRALASAGTRLAASPTFKCLASSCDTWARAITCETSMMVIIGLPLVHDFSRRSDIDLRLLGFLRYCSLQNRLVICLRLFVCGLTLGTGARKILVLQLREQLPGAHPRAAIDVELFYGSGNLWDDRRLLQRIEQRVGGDLQRDGSTQHGCHIHRDDVFAFGFFFRFFCRAAEQ